MRKRGGRDIEIVEGGFVVEANVLAGLLDVAAREIPPLMRRGKINCVCEIGADEHEGEHRLSFFYGTRRARLRVNGEGQIIQRSAVDFGNRGGVAVKVGLRSGRLPVGPSRQ